VIIKPMNAVAGLIFFAVFAPGRAASEVLASPVAVFSGHRNEVMTVAFFPDGLRLISGSDDKTIRVWDIASGRSVAWAGLSSAVNGLAVSGDGRRVLSGEDGGDIKLWDAATGRVVTAWTHGGIVNTVALLPDGRRALSGGVDTQVRVWDLASGRELASWRGHRADVMALAVSADGRRVVSGGRDGLICLWDGASGRSLASWKAHEGTVFALDLSADGRRAVSGGTDGAVRVWDVASASATFTWKDGPVVHSVAFSSDASQVLWGNDDGGLNLTDAQTGRHLAFWPAHEATVFAAHFSPDGSRLVSAGWDTKVRLWEVGPLPHQDAGAAKERPLHEQARDLLARRDKYGPLAPPQVTQNSQQVELGRRLFFDRRLSRTGEVSCSTCHQPERAFSDGLPVAKGIHGLAGRRNTLSLLNVRFNHYKNFRWDGSLHSVEAAALAAIENPSEMGQDPKTVFAVAGLTTEEGAQALAAYVLSIPYPADSDFDRFRRGEAALSREALKGFVVFAGKARCLRCHTFPNFTDNHFHRTGLKQSKDPGRYAIDPRPNNRNAFRTPSLRNLALTAPYMHDGQLATLREVIDFYDRGGDEDADRDNIVPLGLTKDEKNALLSFLESLTATR